MIFDELVKFKMKKLVDVFLFDLRFLDMYDIDLFNFV